MTFLGHSHDEKDPHQKWGSTPHELKQRDKLCEGMVLCGVNGTSVGGMDYDAVKSLLSSPSRPLQLTWASKAVAINLAIELHRSSPMLEHEVNNASSSSSSASPLAAIEQVQGPISWNGLPASLHSSPQKAEQNTQKELAMSQQEEEKVDKESANSKQCHTPSNRTSGGLHVKRTTSGGLMARMHTPNAGLGSAMCPGDA
jgi:hypothetical protein